MSPPRRARPPSRPALAGKPDRVPEGDDDLALVQRLVTELGAPHLLRLMADAAMQHADALAQQGASPHAARLSREAALLNRAAHEILE